MVNTFNRLGMQMQVFLLICVAFFAGTTETVLAQAENNHANVYEIPTPEGFVRVPVQPGSFGDYLRNFRLRIGDPTLYLFDGSAKSDQDSHVAILDIDVGNRDLQQCADAVMRLQAEHLYAKGNHHLIQFLMASGKQAVWQEYAKGDYSRTHFRKYLNWVFAYANTRSLHVQMNAQGNPQFMQPGDVFLQTGNPYGHAMLVLDVAIKGETGERVFLLAQSYMPAQDIHIVINPNDQNQSPWFTVQPDQPLVTPSWTFDYSDLKRF